MCVRKLQHVPFVFVQNPHGKWVMKDCAMIEHLMSSSLAGDHQGCAAGLIWLHVRGLLSLHELIAHVSGASGAWHADIFRSTEFDSARSIGADEREKNPIDDLFYVLRGQRLLQDHELIAHEVETQPSEA